MSDAFRAAIQAGYTLSEPAVVIGSAMHDAEIDNDVRLQVALSMLNRHGLIAGAAGTGKAKSPQPPGGQVAHRRVPVLVPDVKGDGAGIGAPGDGANPKVVER